MIDLIDDEEQQSKLKSLCNKIISSSDSENEYEELKVSMETMTIYGIEDITYTLTMWKTTWKLRPAIGIKLTKTSRNDLRSEIHIKDVYYANSLKTIESKFFKSMKSIDQIFTKLSLALESKAYNTLNNQVILMKEEIDQFTWIYVLMNNFMVNGKLLNQQKIPNESFYVKNVLLFVGDHFESQGKKNDNDIVVRFSDDVSFLIKTKFKVFFILIYSFPMMFNMTQKSSNFILECRNEENQKKHVLTLKFRIVMKRPKQTPPNKDMFDEQIPNPSMENFTEFLKSAIVKFASFLGGDIKGESGECTGNNNLKVKFVTDFVGQMDGIFNYF